jgi:hypothetical protein
MIRPFNSYGVAVGHHHSGFPLWDHGARTLTVAHSEWWSELGDENRRVLLWFQSYFDGHKKGWLF